MTEPQTSQAEMQKLLESLEKYALEDGNQMVILSYRQIASIGIAFRTLEAEHTKMREALEEHMKLLKNHWAPSSGGCTFCDAGRIVPCPANASFKATQEALAKLK